MLISSLIWTILHRKVCALSWTVKEKLFANDTRLDFDPEDEENDKQGSDDESGSEVDENAGREHYEKVG